MDYKLVDEKTNVEIEVGSTVTTFRGEKWKLTGFRPPRTENSTGRVHLADEHGMTAEFYPGVIGAKIVARLEVADLSQATAVTINMLRKAVAELSPPQKYVVQSINENDETNSIGITEHGQFDSYADAFRAALRLAQTDQYVEILKGDELYWDNIHGRSNV